ncbi:MAG: sulfatase-like hydrolase/transferase, partial [Planctomycetota bacterium]
SRWSFIKTEHGRSGTLDGPTPGDQGFDYWFACDNNALPSHLNPINYLRNGAACGKLEGYACDLVAAEAITWLRDHRPADRPFFLNVWFNEPHHKLASPPTLIAKYEARGIDTFNATYLANIENLDGAIGTLVTALDELGLRDNTLIVFTSDHGSYRHASNVPLREGKSSMYDGGLRVPGIWRWPGRISAGSSSAVATGFVDLLPTFAALADAPLPSVHLDGCDISALLQHGSAPARQQPLFWYFYKAAPTAALRAGEWMLMVHDSAPHRSFSHAFDTSDLAHIKQATLGHAELYHLSHDPGQTTDLADQEPERVAQMRAQLEQIHAAVISEGPDWPTLQDDLTLLSPKQRAKLEAEGKLPQSSK